MAVTAVQLDVGGTVLAAELDDNPTARALLALLPITLTLHDFNETEKVADLPRRLPVNGAPDFATPRTGDIAYYAPWGNLAIYYRGFRSSPGLVVLGRITSDLRTLSGAANGTAATLVTA